MKVLAIVAGRHNGNSEILAKELRKRGYGISTRRTVKAIERVCESFELRSPDDLFASIHTGKVSVKQAANRIEEILEEGSPEQLAAQAAQAQRQRRRT